MGINDVDLAGNFIYFNQAMCDMLGYAREELTGMNNRAYMDKNNAGKVFDVFNQVFRTKKGGKVFGWELIRKDEDISENTAVEMGIRKYIQKPISPQALLKIIRHILDEK